MRSRTRDVVVGIFITLVILILIIGLNWISGSEGFGGGTSLYARFDNVEGLISGAGVSMRGIQIGRVDNLELHQDYVIVSFRIKSDYTILQGSKAQIKAFSYLGGERHIEIIPGNGPPMAKGDTIEGEGGVGIEEMVSKLENLTRGLDFEPLSKSFDELNRTLKIQLNRGMNSLEHTLSRLDRLTVRIDSILVTMKSRGTVSKLITSDELYQELRETNKEVRGLIEDIKKHPERYFRVKIF